MKATDLLINIASEFTGKKAFAQADSATTKLTKNVKKLGKSLGLALGATALTAYSKNAVKAFAADDQAAQMLTKSLKNLGLEFEAVNVSKFISEMESLYGVLDDKLRPAFQQLLTTTGSVTKSQELLTTALNLSRATGTDITSTAADLSKAYVGQTRALSKYGLGLSQAELKAMSFQDVQDKINKTFAGQATIAANSYAGKLDKLTVAAENAKETIGKGLIDGLTALGGEGGFPASIKLIEGMSIAVADLFVGLGRTGNILRLFFTGKWDKIKSQLDEYKKLDMVARQEFGGAAADVYKKQAEARAAKLSKERAKLESKLLAQKLAKEKAAADKIKKAQRDLAALNKANTLFDMEKIQIIAALKGKISDDERKRLELQLAVATENVDEASKLTYELAKSQGLTESLARTLASLPAAKNPFASWEAYLDTIAARAKEIASMSFGTGAAATGQPSGGMALPASQDLSGFSFAPEILAAIKASTPIVNVTLDGQQLTSQITVNQQNNSLSGITPTEQRLFGSF